MSIGRRTLLVLCGVAALSTVLALVIQDRALSRDLKRAAMDRLEAATDSTRLLVRNHIDAARERYRAISGTPQFRATLEVNDGPTLQFYARQLAAREGAELVAFVDRAHHVTASWGDATLVESALDAAQTGLIAQEEVAYAVSVIPLRTREHLIGQLVAVERIDIALVDQWSELCGARVSFSRPGAPLVDMLARVAHQLPGLDLRVAISLDAERAALVHSRVNLLAAGGIAFGLAFLVSLWVSRGLVKPILQIKRATLRIGEGDFSARIESTRGDEIGDVARSVDTMLKRLIEYREQVDLQHTTLEENIDELRVSRAQLASAQRLAQIGSFQFDLAEQLFVGSEEFRSIFRLGDLDRSFTTAELIDRVHPDDREALTLAFRASIDDQLLLRMDFRIFPDGSHERVLHIHAQPRHDDAGKAVRLEGTVQDVTERKRSEQQIRYLAYHDNLTGLGNRLHCGERLEIQIAQAARENSWLGILYIDLDRFKRINDTLGHAVGDDLLKLVADRIVASLRDSDYIGRNQNSNSISRLGGDEFTVLVADLQDAQDLDRIARRIIRSFAEPFLLGTHEIRLTCTIGIATYPHDGDDVDSLLTNADAAMHHAKEHGRNNYQFYDQSMNEAALRRLILENKMRVALEREEFELFYQPKVSVETEKTTSVEALIRWHDPESGMVGPDIFIPIAEETGLINPLGDWVLREACSQISAWAKAGNPRPISVNLSTHQFRVGNLADRILDIVEEIGVDPNLLELEITESTLMQDEKIVIADLERLRAEGIKTSLDDFGTGYSSFAYLKRLPVDTLKIDRCFVTEIENNAADAKLTASIVSMGKALGLGIVAEGVETRGQRDLLAQWGCDEIQGYYYSRPLPAAELEAWLLRESGNERS